MVLLSVKKTTNQSRTWHLMDFLAARAYHEWGFFELGTTSDSIALLAVGRKTQEVILIQIIIGTNQMSF